MIAYCPTCRTAVETAATDQISLGGAVLCPRCRSRLEPWHGPIGGAAEAQEPAEDAGASATGSRLPPGCRPLPDAASRSTGSIWAIRRVMDSTWHGRLVTELIRLLAWVGLLVLLPALGVGLGLIVGDGRMAGRFGIGAIVLLMVVASRLAEGENRRHRRPTALAVAALAAGGAYFGFDHTDSEFAFELAAAVGILVFVVIYYNWPSAD